MSDLQCAAVLLVARHGHAHEPEPGDDGDLGLTSDGVAQACAFADSLRGRRVAGLFTSTLRRAVETGAVVGAELGLEPEALAGLVEFDLGPDAQTPDGEAAAVQVMRRWVAGDLDAALPGGESGTRVVDRFRDAAEEIADRFRGETVLVVSHGGVMSLVLPHLAAGQPGMTGERWIPPCGVAEVHVDADGWSLRTWPGSTDVTVAGH
ncbi:histidine phosphatase family protein [Occultella glacieicola]|uniref:histidine phosphatase family protein n=1 Tax=Occultella glacieicola TaxID=2518684 RepID=UPI0014052273|nr:histidine phosphatase family protein [Occultella glacieicola]